MGLNSNVAQGLCLGHLALSGEYLAKVYAWLPTTAIILIAIIGGLHHLLQWRAAYRQLSHRQVVTALHACYALIFTVQMAPFTYMVAKILYGGNFLTE
jgi:hypothetical protein